MTRIWQLLVGALLACGLMAQVPRITVAEAAIAPAEASPGDEVILSITIDVEDGYHVYGAFEEIGGPTTLTIDAAPGLRIVGPAEIPAGTAHDTAGVVSHWVEGRAVLRQKLKVPDGTPAGKITVRGHIDYTACTPEFCEPPTDEPVEASVTVLGDRTGETAQDPGVASNDLNKLLGFGADQTKIEIAAVRATPNPARPGETVDLIVSLKVPEGWHVYGAKDDNPITLEAGAIDGLVPKGKLRVPDGELHELTPEIRNYELSGSFEARQAFEVLADAEPGTIDLEGEFVYLLCDENGCLPEQRKAVAVQLAVEAGEARAEYVGLEFDGAGSEGLWALILAAIGAGLFALLMPCTYPMIPITISFFTKKASDRGRSVLPLSLTYGAGIVVMFVLIGVVVGPAIVPFATHWLTNLVIAAAFVVFAFVLFGLIDLQPPQFLMNAAGKASRVGGIVGVFAMGLTLVVTSFTCTVPFVGALLGLASRGGMGDVVIGMGVFGLTMAAPFVLLSLLPGRLQAMPRAGEWMNTLKVFLGFVELAAALKFVSNVDVVVNEGPRWLTHGLFLWIWAVLFAVAGMYLLGVFKKHAQPIAWGRISGAVLSLVFGAYSAYGAVGNPLDPVMTAIAPPQQLGDHEIVKDDFDKALALATAQDKLVLINFTGFT